MEEGISLAFDNETGTWAIKKEPFAVVEFETEEDYNLFLEMVRFYKQNHKQEEN
jgi:hypothetical protein